MSRVRRGRRRVSYAVASGSRERRRSVTPARRTLQIVVRVARAAGDDASFAGPGQQVSRERTRVHSPASVGKQPERSYFISRADLSAAFTEREVMLRTPQGR